MQAIRALCAIALMSIACIPAIATAQAWPAKPVRIIAPFAPGGSADTLGRIVATKLTESLGQNFVVENRGGAGGIVGVESVIRGTPDGYTLIVTGMGPLIVASAMASKLPFDPVKDFTHIALFGGSPSVLGTHPSLPARDVKGFIALAKARPGTINYGSAGHGSTGQMLMELLKRSARIEIEHVPYKGASQAVADLVGGHISASCGTLPSMAAQIRAGRIRALAMSSAARLPDYPEVPTYRESGFPQLVQTVWFSLSGPPGLPGEIVTRLNGEVRRVLQLPDVRERLRAQAIDAPALSPKEFTDFVADEFRRWAPLVRELNTRSQ
jgi:tripartite-type tricarboxylate transporter receptor subunit TctC